MSERAVSMSERTVSIDAFETVSALFLLLLCVRVVKEEIMGISTIVIGIVITAVVYAAATAVAIFVAEDMIGNI